MFSQKALREQVKTIKEGDNPATGTPGTVPDCLAIPSAANMVSMGETPIAVSDTPEVPASAEAAGKAHPQRPAATGRADLNVQAQKMRVVMEIRNREILIAVVDREDAPVFHALREDLDRFFLSKKEQYELERLIRA